MKLRQKPKIETTEADFSENNQQDHVSYSHRTIDRSHDNSYHTDNVSEDELVKLLCHCVLANVSKRGFVRDADIGEIFSDQKEREMRANVLEKTKKLLNNVLGYRLDRDEEAKRFYLSTDLCEGSGIALQMADEPQRGLCDESDDFKAEESESEQFTNCLLEMGLMFIFMTKKHIGNRTEAEKGVDQALLKGFLDDLFEAFGRRHISGKQFGQLFGPAKSAEFIAHGWLRCDIQRDTVTGSEQIFYHWGPRSETVVSKKRMLEAFCEIYGTTPNNFQNHAKIAGLRGK